MKKKKKKINLEYKGDSSPMLSPKFFVLLPKTIPTSPHADTGHECSYGFLSHSTSSYLVQLKSSGNSSGLLKPLIRHLSDFRIPDQWKPHSSFISSSVHTPIRCCKLSIMLLSTEWSQAQLSIDNIINLDHIHQYRPKSAIGKTPIEKRNRPSTLLQTDNYL